MWFLTGLLADRQRVGDLLVGHALGDVVEDLDLARGQRREDRGGVLAVDGQLAELLEDARRDGRLGEDLVVDEVLAADDAPDDRDRGRPGPTSLRMNAAAPALIASNSASSSSVWASTMIPSSGARA
jgi:hypothetical protein